jgi:two-component system LytT family sensor kinase
MMEQEPIPFRETITVRLLLAVVGLVFAWGTLMALFAATAYYENYAFQGYSDMRFLQQLLFPLANYWPWVALSPLILYISQRIPFRRSAWRRFLLAHLVLAAVFALTKLWAMDLFYSNTVGRKWLILGYGNFLLEYFTYWTFLAVFSGLSFYRRLRDREIKASQLQAKLAQAHLQVLKMQLHPHFLFNTLHAISTLMHRDIDAADRMISRLSDLLRLSLESIKDQEFPLRKELDFLQRYLEIEQIRFGERLSVEREIDPQTLDAGLPSFLLQPVLENAINHGVGKSAGKGLITLRARREQEQLVLEVQDNGPGLPAADVERISRVGLANTRARLEQSYGGESGLAFISPPEGGLLVRLSIPFHTVAAT